jgi:hypothetical protein
VWSSAMAASRMNGTSAPCSMATAASSGSSVLTTTRSKQPASTAARIVCAIIGSPPRGSRFLRGKRLEPPLAGMTARFPPGADMAGVYVGHAHAAVKPAAVATSTRGTFLWPWLGHYTSSTA